MVIWLTGLPGAGKTTIGQILMDKLRGSNYQTILLDGDKLRSALGQHGYDLDSRKELSFSYGKLAKMFSEQGTIAICATVSMFDDVRQWNADNIADYLEVYVKVSPEVLQQRNQKKLYSDAKAGNEVNVVGFDIACQEPKSPDLILKNDGRVTPEALANRILTLIKS